MPARMRRRITTAKREEIEAEQKALDNAIIRPFTILEDLPISYNEPPNGHYDEILKSPLTIKDSAVLYNSLIRSRNSYVFHAPMFRLHWVKQTAYAKKLAEMDKEKQKEILSDRENKRRFAKATTNSLEARTRTPVLSPDVNARDVMSKLCESSITLGPHTMEIRIFIAKDSRSEKSKAISELPRMNEPIVTKENKANGEQESEPNPSTSDGTVINAQNSPLEKSINLPTNIASPTMIQTRAQEDSSEIIEPNKASELRTTIGASVNNLPGDGTTMSNGKNTPHYSDPRNSTEITHEAPSALDSFDQTPRTEAIQARVVQEPHQIKRGSDKSPQDSAMTPPDTNRREQNIRSAFSSSSGSKSTNPESLIAPAKATLTTKAHPNNNALGGMTGSQTRLSAPGTISKTGSSPAVRTSATNLQSIDNTVMISNLNAIAKIDLSLNDLMKEVASGKASEPQISRFKKYIERAKQMGPQPHHAELYFNRGLSLPPDFPRPYQSRPVIEKKPPPKPKIFNPMKLTAFQERYLHNATLVFEFLENPNVRYIIPQDSICEVLKPTLPLPEEAEAGIDYNDILVSHLWVHNIDEVEEFEKRSTEYEAELKKQKDEELKRGTKALEDESAEGKDPQECEKRSKSDPRSLRGKRKVLFTKKKKAISPPVPPHIKYTAFSFTIHNIPSKFIPIFQNSMKPIKDVQTRMEDILKSGTRLSSFFLWYQVDARLDEALAENLRLKVASEEKKMTGFLPPAEPKKRKPRDNKLSRNKRVKNSSALPDKTEPPDSVFGSPPNLRRDPNTTTSPTKIKGDEL